MVRLIDNSIYLQTIVCLTVVYHCCSVILACNYRYLSVIPKYKFPNNTKCRHKVVVITVRKKLIQKFRTKLLYLLYYLSKLTLDNNYNFDKIYNFSRWWEIMWFEQTIYNFFVNFSLIPIEFDWKLSCQLFHSHCKIQFMSTLRFISVERRSLWVFIAHCEE